MYWGKQVSSLAEFTLLRTRRRYMPNNASHRVINVSMKILWVLFSFKVNKVQTTALATQIIISFAK
jgi:oxalate decarboxylase/phosphoglucose isomerase-like protein (cupin superfamily)